MGVPANATLRDIYLDGNWTIRSPRTDKQLQVQAYLSNLQLTEEEDTYEWNVEGQHLQIQYWTDLWNYKKSCSTSSLVPDYLV